jgi:hypothetical protein
LKKGIKKRGVKGGNCGCDGDRGFTELRRLMHGAAPLKEVGARTFALIEEVKGAASELDAKGVPVK